MCDHNYLDQQFSTSGVTTPTWIAYQVSCIPGMLIKIHNSSRISYEVATAYFYGGGNCI